jgi:hypothetical protein
MAINIYYNPHGQELTVKWDAGAITFKHNIPCYHPSIDSSRAGKPLDEFDRELYMSDLTRTLESALMSGERPEHLDDLLAAAGAYLGIQYKEEPATERTDVNLNDYIRGMESGLQRLAYQAIGDQKVEREAENLIAQYLKGNTNPGIGTKRLPSSDIYYLRGRGGARVFFRIKDNYFVTLGIASKCNEENVINAVQRL